MDTHAKREQTEPEKALAEIRDISALYHLRRRPRCIDGTLDMRFRVNKAFTKRDQVSDYYDPLKP